MRNASVFSSFYNSFAYNVLMGFLSKVMGDVCETMVRIQKVGSHI